MIKCVSGDIIVKWMWMSFPSHVLMDFASIWVILKLAYSKDQESPKKPEKARSPNKPESPKSLEAARLGFWPTNPTRKPKSLAWTVTTIDWPDREPMSTETRREATPVQLRSGIHQGEEELSEASVKAMKALVAKASVNGDIMSKAFQRGLLEWRTTPKAHGKSPAELVFGHQQRTLLPSLPANFRPAQPEWKEAIEKRNVILQEKSRYYYNAGSKFLPELELGAYVRIQNADMKCWDKQGEIIKKGPNRDYHICLENGKVRWRNKRFLRPLMVPAELIGGARDVALVRDEELANAEVRPRRSGRKRQRTERFGVR